ncbi:MAG TPA: ABC transporter permease [Vicinamibacterales bacterium]|nr:ABC transporter permease [Vicinamibacterales bacterium]
MWLEQLRRDIQIGVRGLLATPGVASLAILSLALGIMATTAIYSVVHAVVIDPFAYRDVDSLMSVRVWSPTQRGFRTGYTVDQFLEIAERSTIFEGVIASTISDVFWTDDGEPQRLRGNHGTFNTFEVMGVPALIGRTAVSADAAAGREPVVVLGYRFWQRQFGGDPGVIGRQMKLNDTIRTVVGVMPKRFMWRGADVYLPTSFQRGQFVEGVRSVHLLGRLKPGVTEAMAEADLRPIIEDLRRQNPQQFPEQWRVGLLSFEETFPSGIRRDLWVLLGAVGLLLLIACANVSNLLLSRAGARQREMTVRAALGASRQRLIRQLLTETLVLALVAGAVGTALAYAGLPAILAMVPPGTIPDESEIALNTPVLVFALVVSVAASVFCGLAPALHGSRRDLAGALRESGRTLAGGSRQAILRATLVVSEVALSLILLAGSGVLIRSFVAMQRVEPGYPPDRILALRVPLPPSRYPDAARRIAFFQELVPRIESVPGVTAVGLNTGFHPLGNMWTGAEVSGEPPSQDPVVVHQINAGYLRTFDVQLATGRLLTDADVTAAQPVALVNERFALTGVSNRSPLGLMVRLPRLPQLPFGSRHDSFQIVGVVRDTPNDGLAEPVLPEIYLPFTVTGLALQLAIRTNGDPLAVARPVTSQIYAVDRVQPVTGVMALDAMIREQEFATPRFNLVLLSVFAALGLALALVGVYGVMSSAVAQERHEIGIRMALGADSPAILRMIISRGARLLLAGIALGLLGSYAAGRLLAGQVWNVRAFDPLGFAAVAILLAIAGLQACYWPARRAARTDPLIALRLE